MSSPRSTPLRSDALPVGVGDSSLFPPLSHGKTSKIYSLSNSTQSKALPIDSSSPSSSGWKTNSVRADAMKISSPINRNFKTCTNPKQSLENHSMISQEKKAKPTYLSMVDNNLELRFSIDSNHVAGSDILEIPQEVIDDSEPLWKDLIVGRFLDSPPFIGITQVIVNKIWNVGAKKLKIIATELEDRLVQFKISDSKVRDKILDRGMWNIAGVPMIVSVWSPAIDEPEPVITTLPLWITIKNIPRCLFSRTGVPKKLHQDTELCKKFDEAKVFMDLNLTKDLPTELIVKEQSSGVVSKLTFHYPWLPPRCIGCGRWGHLQGKCKVSMKGGESTISKEQQQTTGTIDTTSFEIVNTGEQEIKTGNTAARDSTQPKVDETKADISFVYNDLINYSNSLKKATEGIEQSSATVAQEEKELDILSANETEQTKVLEIESPSLTEMDIKQGSDNLVNETQGISEGISGKEDGEIDHREWLTPSRPIKNPKLLSKNQQVVLETRFEALVQKDDMALETDSAIGDDLQKDTERLSPSHPIKSPKQISKNKSNLLETRFDTSLETITGYDSDYKQKVKVKKYRLRRYL